MISVLMSIAAQSFPIYSIPMFLTGAGVLAFGMLTLFRKPTALNKLFFQVCLTVSTWSLCEGFAYIQKSPEKALLCQRLAFIGVVFIGTSFYHFVCRFLNLNRKPFIRGSYVLSTLFLCIMPTRLFFTGEYLYFWGFYPKAGPAFGAFIAFFYAGFFASLFEIVKAYRAVRKDPKQAYFANQVRYVLASLVVASLSFSDYPGNYGIPCYPFAWAAAAGWFILVALGTIRYQVIDINLILRQTVIYSAATAGLTAAYVAIIATLTHLFMAPATVWTAAIAAIMITLLFLPLRNRIQHFVDRHFFRNTLDEQLLQEMTRGIAHEIKRPLASISMPAELALMDLQTVKEKIPSKIYQQMEERLRHIVSESMNAAKRIESIRAVSAPHEEPMKFVGLREIFLDALALEKSRIGEASVDVQISTDLHVRVRPQQLSVVFVNLIKNAVEAESSQITVHAKAEGSFVILSFKDNGHGIPPEIQRRLFEPYFSTKGAKGMGLGLYLAYKIIKTHDGRIEVTNVEGCGTEFTIRLPGIRAS